MSTDFHPEYVKNKPLWSMVRLAHEGQNAIREAGKKYLPATSGMTKKTHGEEQYKIYNKRARFYPLTHDYIDVIIGLATENELILDNQHGSEMITKNGLDISMLTAECLENTGLIGRHILVNDAVENRPYIAQYSAESFVDWATDDFGEFIWGKFQEIYDDNQDPRKRDLKTRYREYYLDNGKWTVYTTNESGETTSEIIELSLPVDKDQKQLCPITVLGSRSNKSNIDNIPSLPIVEASIAAYQLNADLRQGLYGVAQPTPWGTGIDNDDIDRIIEMGIGVGSFLSSQDDKARFGMLEMSGDGLSSISAEIKNEIDIGKEQALRIVNQTNNAETAQAVAMRTNSQRATVWTMFQSVSSGIERALSILDKWQGYNKDVVFEIKADFTQAEAESTMLTALNNTVNADNAPRSVLFQWMRDSKLTDKTDEELEQEIATQTPSMTV